MATTHYTPSDSLCNSIRNSITAVPVLILGEKFSAWSGDNSLFNLKHTVSGMRWLDLTRSEFQTLMIRLEWGMAWYKAMAFNPEPEPPTAIALLPERSRIAAVVAPTTEHVIRITPQPASRAAYEAAHTRHGELYRTDSAESAYQRYFEKYGKRPTAIRISKYDSAPNEVHGVAVERIGAVLPGYVWVGDR